MDNHYPPIADHGVIGDLQTAALVTTDGSIDWYCCPRFDAPSVFASLLDLKKGGHFRIAPQGHDYVTKQLYFPDSAILNTRFMAADGVGEVIDFMPIDHPEEVSSHHEIVRLVRVVRGEMRFTLDCQPRFDYARKSHVLEMSKHGATFSTPDLTLTLHANTTVGADPISLQRKDNDVHASFTLRAGQIVGVTLESASQRRPGDVTAEEVRQKLNETINYWQDWLSQSTYQGRWREVVARSAMTLKLMIYAPTGAPVAALTAGLPEQIGGERNWDYRYTWIRDASFSVYALLGLGYNREALSFMQWVRDRLPDKVDVASKTPPLKIMYRVDGSSELHEENLDHLEGYMGSRPVRIGNGAADQLQLDIYGEFMDSAYQGYSQGYKIAYFAWNRIQAMMNWLCSHWDESDAGIWETRGGPQPFTYGRLMSWVAMDRLIRMAQDQGLPLDTARITAERDKIYQQIMQKGWNAKRGAFTQHYNTEVLDASLLMMPLVGFIAPNDPRWISMLRAVDQELVSDSLVYRYDPSASPDGLRGHEGTFSICTYWYVDALARSGRLEDARLVFEKMSTYANHLQLFAEEIGPTGGQQGNFPQAFTHLSLINAAMNLNYQLDHGIGEVGLSQIRSKRTLG